METNKKITESLQRWSEKRKKVYNIFIGIFLLFPAYLIIWFVVDVTKGMQINALDLLITGMMVLVFLAMVYQILQTKKREYTSVKLVQTYVETKESKKLVQEWISEDGKPLIKLLDNVYYLPESEMYEEIGSRGLYKTERAALMCLHLPETYNFEEK